MNEAIADGDGAREGATCRAACEASVAMVTAAALNVADTAAAAARRARTVSA